MRVQDIMTPDPITLNPRNNLREANRMAQEHGLRRFPVISNGRLVGIVTDRDLRQAGLSTAVVHERRYSDYVLERVLIGGIMSRQLVTVPPETPVEDAARLILEHKVGGLPVVRKDKLVGIITETDILRAFVQLQEAARGV